MGNHIGFSKLLRRPLNPQVSDSALFSFISAHAERDTPVVLVSDLVGHSRVTTTQTHYTRVRGGERQRIESLRSVL